MSLWDIVSWLVVGGLAGWAASSLLKLSTGLVTNVAVGVVGALVGGWLAGLLLNDSGATADAFSVRNFVIALVGALVLLVVLKLVRK